MPGRPPREWMHDCITGAEASALNPGAVCGALWYHKMTPQQRAAALRRENNPGTLLGMAKGKQPAALAAYQAAMRATHTPQTIVVRQSRAPATTHKGKGKGRRHHGVSSEKQLMGLIVGGFILGYLDKPGGPAIPTIPLLGKAGTIAVVTHFIGKGRRGMVTDVRNAAASVAAYEFGFKGSVSGDDGTL